jgi:hypothetical protein
MVSSGVLGCWVRRANSQLSYSLLASTPTHYPSNTPRTLPLHMVTRGGDDVVPHGMNGMGHLKDTVSSHEHKTHTQATPLAARPIVNDSEVPVSLSLSHPLSDRSTRCPPPYLTEQGKEGDDCVRWWDGSPSRGPIGEGRQLPSDRRPSQGALCALLVRTDHHHHHHVAPTVEVSHDAYRVTYSGVCVGPRGDSCKHVGWRCGD